MSARRKKLKIGVIGTGHMGQYHVNVLSTMITHQLVGVYDVDMERARQIVSKYESRAYTNLDSLLTHCDAVVVAVPTMYHYDVAKKALLAGCHVLLEKPITETVEQAEELVSIAQEKGLILQVGHVERFNGAVMELHKIVMDPIFIEAKRMAPFTPRIKDVGVILDMMIHDLDIVLNLVNAKVLSYEAMGRSIMSDQEDIASIRLVFENGTMATLLGSRVSQLKERVLNIVQDKSYICLNYSSQDIEIHRQASAAYLMTREEIKYSQESFIEKLYVHKDNPLKSEHTHFYECILGITTPMVPNTKDIETLKIALDSMEQVRENLDLFTALQRKKEESIVS
ncbi:MAG: gfo/Idh/MocA family oxidoreductase [Candidatus Hydrogenedentota bacterium]|nr:MAG: gfo/Idh/MocA family oxidoreductase [Candidatus Hydrogenedentota bacterium]